MYIFDGKKVIIKLVNVQCRKKERAQQIIQLSGNESYIPTAISTDKLVADSDLHNYDILSPLKTSE